MTIRKIRYFTKERLDLINPKNIKVYKTYQTSRLSKNKDVKDTTYKVYESYMNHFLVYLAEQHDNLYLYDDEFQELAVDIMEGFMNFCQEVLFNNKKVINTKVSAVSSFFHWSVKRGKLEMHPFDGKLDRMENAKEEKIIGEHFLDDSEIEKITRALRDQKKKFDFQDRLIWHIMLDSCNRVGAIEKLTLSSLDLEDMAFKNIREKRGKVVEVIFEEPTKRLIEKWLRMRKEDGSDEIDGFFVTRYKGEWRTMTRNTIQTRIKKMGTVIGLEDFRSHSIRKTAATRLYKQTGQIELVAEMLNHDSIETTMAHYIKPETKMDTRRRIAEAKRLKAEKKDG